jgi:aspartyl-tRNA(Asn)/glutamyl-tRNA(Gln) amidotransferase subunit A
MPFGVQLGVLPWQETEVLQVAIDYQAAYPYWSETPPPLKVPRTLTTAEVVMPPSSSTRDPTGTVATRPAVAVVPTLSAMP